MEVNVSEKGKYLLKIVIATAVVYFALKYLLPLFLPFLGAYLLAHILKPMVRYLEQRFHINRKISTAILLIIVSAIITLALGYVVYIVRNQIRSFVCNIDQYQEMFNKASDTVCSKLGKISGFPKEKIKCGMDEGINRLVDNNQNDAVNTIMNKSVDTIVGIIEGIVVVITIIVGAFYIVVDSEKNKEKRNSNPFLCELIAILRKVYRVGAAYVKTQLIIMAITSTVCFVSFMIIKNPYALVVAIIVGALDALPLFGIGVVLIPWSVILYFMGDYYRGTIILITFIVCYLIREVFEPKIMGNQIGITPLATIISMYVGYKVFGIVGVVLGPIGYIMITTILSVNEENEKKKKEINSR